MNNDKFIVPIEPKTSCVIAFKKVFPRKALFSLVPAKYKAQQYNKLTVNDFNFNINFSKTPAPEINGLTFLLAPLALHIEALFQNNKINVEIKEIEYINKELRSLMKYISKMQPFYFTPYKIKPFIEIKNLERDKKEKLLTSLELVSSRAQSFSDYLIASNELQERWTRVYTSLTKIFKGLGIDNKKPIFTLLSAPNKTSPLNLSLLDIDKTINSMMCPQTFAYTQEMKKDWFFTSSQAQEISVQDDMKDFVSFIKASPSFDTLKSIPLCFLPLDRPFSRGNKISYKEKVLTAKLNFPSVDNLKLLLSLDGFKKLSRIIFDPLGLELRYGKLEKFILTRDNHCEEYVRELNIALSKATLESFFETLPTSNGGNNPTSDEKGVAAGQKPVDGRADKKALGNKVSKI